MKKSISMLLILSVLLTTFASCGNETSGEQTPDTTSPGADETQAELETEAETEVETEPLDPADILELPEMNWEGREFNILGQLHDPWFSSLGFNTDEITGEVLNDAIYNRNRALEEKYTVTITQTLSDGEGTNVGVIRTATAAGEETYDIASVDAQRIGPLAMDNLLYDLNLVDYIDFSKNWWSPVANESLSIANKLFFTTSDFTLKDKERLNVIVYNKDMVKNNNLESPMDLVRNGQWTLEKFFQMAESMGQDPDGNGSIDESDQFGIFGSSGDLLNALVAGCGFTLVDKDEEDIPIIVEPENIVGILDMLISYWTNQRTVTIDEDWSGKVSYDYWSTHRIVFYRGGALFLGASPQTLPLLSADSEVDYGALPLPKYNEEQARYYSIADGYSQLICIPTATTEPEFSGFMLEALSAASTDTTLKAYIDISCKGKYVYDEDSAEMLDLIFDNVIYDQASIFDIAGPKGVLRSYATKKSHSYASDYARMNKMAKKSIEKLVESVLAAGEAQQ